MDAQLVEHDRQRLLAIERLILETICFNFTSRMPFPYVIKMARSLRGMRDVVHACLLVNVREQLRRNLPSSRGG